MSRFDWIFEQRIPSGADALDDEVVELETLLDALEAHAGDARIGQPRRPIAGQKRQQIERAEFALDIGTGRTARCRARAMLGVGTGPLFCHPQNVRTIARAFKRNAQ